MKEEENGNAGFMLAKQVLEQLPTPVMAVNGDFEIIFMNAAGQNFLGKSWQDLRGSKCHDVFASKHCNTPDCCMRKAMAEDKPHSDRNWVEVGGTNVPIEYFAAALKDEDGHIVGGLEYILDITERVRYEERLKEQARTIREISTPAIQLWDGIIILPVVGIIDSVRAQFMMDVMLTRIAETACKVMILDIQGVPAVDTAVANHLIKIVKAIRLMGAQAVISGISPAVAQTIVTLGIEMGVKSTATLRDALAEAFEIIHCEVRRIRSANRGQR
ncbi:MAG: STAS domain-containing protein [Chloroflexota bacterium]